MFGSCKENKINFAEDNAQQLQKEQRRTKKKENRVS